MKNKTIAVVSLVLAFLLFWFSGILPQFVASLVARAHIEKGYTYLYTEYSPAHDMYLCYFENESGESRHLGIIYRFFPFDVLYDSAFPG